jgi:lactate permease
MVGLAQAVTAWTVVAILGPEFPSLLGPVAGFAIAFLLLRFKWLVPSETQLLATSQSRDHELTRLPSRLLALTPYLILVASLIITRTRALPVGEWLSHWKLGSNDLFATGITAQLQPLYSPGTVFVICAGMCVWIFRATWADLCDAARTAGRVTLKTSVALLAAIVTVRIFLQSGGNQTGLPAMPLVLAETLSIGLGSIWPAVAPIVGALGSFISGSATFSNMLFALLQLQVAIKLDYDPTQILALQGIGAAAGNMTCIHNVVAACAVAGILGQEGNVIRQTAIPMFFYLFFAGLLGLLV